MRRMRHIERRHNISATVHMTEISLFRVLDSQKNALLRIFEGPWVSMTECHVSASGSSIRSKTSAFMECKSVEQRPAIFDHIDMGTHLDVLRFTFLPRNSLVPPAPEKLVAQSRK